MEYDSKKKVYTPGIVTNIVTNDLLLVYFTDTPYTQTYDYSTIYQASRLVKYSNLFPYRDLAFCNENPCEKKL